MVRPAENADVEELRAIERAVGEAFRPLGMDPVADDEPPSIAALRRFIDAGRAWVMERGGQVAAYLVADIVDGCVHVEHVSVHPDHAHQRLGATLVDHLADWSVDHGYPALTLTTFRDVPWNGPYYERCGFHWMADPDITPGLRELRSREAADGLDWWPRGCMRRFLESTPRGASERDAGRQQEEARGRTSLATPNL